MVNKILAAGLAAALLFAGPGEAAEPAAAAGGNGTAVAAAAARNDALALTRAQKRETRRSLRQCLRLLGWTDAASAAYFGGGRKNFSADGTQQIGRLYTVPLFGESVQAGTLYNEAGTVETVTMHLARPQAAPYGAVLRELYGEPDAVDTVPSEGGATWEEWHSKKSRIRLYQEYGLAALELTRRTPDSAAACDAAGWLPGGVKRVAPETKPLPALARAIVAQYGIPRAEWQHTRYRYNYVDLNDDGVQEIFAVVDGPYTSGTGGSSAVWGRLRNGRFILYQTFTLVRTPVLVTDRAANGLPHGGRALVMRRSGGGMPPELVRYVCRDGEYVAEPAASVADVTGIAILCAPSGAGVEGEGAFPLPQGM